ncbi:hypothetical protein A3A49_02260 [Candidatus Curtissbacteria bacterium RIFCSPLOWO2_01_FULL_38_11b]|uniref:UDP-N-acetylmuramate--L-alanine ligase n=1 Tax=Candidatus Curtissbacteria bacterium RIFCSPLOWO2_01_FULL_38_11b TaxID=1797725 RepID=A0A1F5GZ74_9BACT|nr:MAG: hypothetical protein A3A49_02260 [Candidatus Curtissbacteria bacterium RIFCSPLOWO2_01_FULL_38_11b]
MKKNGDLAAIVLAAGLGTRMKSSLSKVLHFVAAKTIIERTCMLLDDLKPVQTIIVVNRSNKDQIINLSKNNYRYVLQPRPSGTADALKSTLLHLKKQIRHVLVLYGDDNIFYKTQTLQKVYQKHFREKSTITFVTVKKQNPTGFGRVFKENNKVIGIIEEKDADKNQKKINEINNGVYLFKRKWLEKNISKLTPSDITKELYLTDLINLASNQNQNVKTYLLKDNNQFFAISTASDLKKANILFEKRIHIMGIRGAGASAVTKIAQNYGFIVDGCDIQKESPYDVNLKNIQIEEGHNQSHITNISKLIVSPAVLKFSPQNAELLRAKKEHIRVQTWQQFQGEILQKGKFVISVAGAYGKSTTTAMIANILKDAGLDPTCEIGANVINWGKNYQLGKSKYYICEADEYMDNFLSYKPDIAVILNTKWDHPDYFKNKKDLNNSYIKFINNLKFGGCLITTAEVINLIRKSIRSDIKIIKIKNFNSIRLKIIGNFRKQNANAALTLAQILNLNIKKAQESLSLFKGIKRRLEYKGKIKETKFYDDYAVAPITIQTTINALAKKFKDKKILLVLEPHTFSRVNFFFNAYVISIKTSKINRVFITDVYPAREKGNVKELSIKLAKAVGKKAQFTGSLNQTANTLSQNLDKFEIVCSMGAGDSYRFYDLVKISHQKENPFSKDSPK